MLEMLRNWKEPAMLALLIYQIIKAENFAYAKIYIHKKEAEPYISFS